MRRCAETRNYARAGANAPTRRSQVSCYTSKSRMTTNTRPSATICFAVTLTTSENSSIGFAFVGAATGAPMTALTRTLVGGYVFWLGHPAPTRHLTAIPRGRDSRGAPPAAHLQVFAHVAAQSDDGRGCEGFTVKHERSLEGLCVAGCMLRTKDSPPYATCLQNE
jgi:hypothetical protein